MALDIVHISEAAQRCGVEQLVDKGLKVEVNYLEACRSLDQVPSLIPHVICPEQTPCADHMPRALAGYRSASPYASSSKC